MEIPDIEVVSLGGAKFSLKRELEKVVEALNNNGWVVLKEATNLAPLESALSSDVEENYVSKDVALNDVRLLQKMMKTKLTGQSVKAILWKARNDDFRITSYRKGKIEPRLEQKQNRVGNWKELAADNNVVGLSSEHLGKDKTTCWKIKVNEGKREDAAERMVEIEANGCDIFLCNFWLLRSMPYPHASSGEWAIRVAYVWVQHPTEFGMNQAVGDKILNLGADSCYRRDNDIVWKCKLT